MTQSVEEHIIGVDVSKNKLDLYVLAADQSYSIINDIESIEQWLEGCSGAIRLAIEPTNTYHLALAHAAYARGHQVYLIDPYRLAHYRESVGQRVKADPQDAQLLARYLQRESGELRLWESLKQGTPRFWRLLKRRATLVKIVSGMKQSLTDLGSLQADVDSLIEQCQKTIKKTDRALLVQAKALGWQAHVRRCQAIPGVGPLTALAMVATYHRGHFRNDDAFIAFMGMDVRVRESGQFRGRRKLSKKGDPELRRLLFNAAMRGRQHSHWEPYYLALRERGLANTAFVALGRKMARLRFVLLKKEADFDPNTVHRLASRHRIYPLPRTIRLPRLSLRQRHQLHDAHRRHRADKRRAPSARLHIGWQPFRVPAELGCVALTGVISRYASHPDYWW